MVSMTTSNDIESVRFDRSRATGCHDDIGAPVMNENEMRPRDTLRETSETSSVRFLLLLTAQSGI